MRNHGIIAFAALARAAAPSYSVSASATASAAPNSSTTTVVYVECSSMAPTATTTDTITSTYCGLCEHMSTTVASGQTHFVTAYTTVYTQVCPTGYIPQTYTITESCNGMNGATPSFQGPSSGHVPEGFTTAYVPCSVCEATPVTNMMTFPITQGPTVTPIPAATTPASPATPAAEAPSSGGGNSPADTNPAGAGSPPAAETYPAAANTPTSMVPSSNGNAAGNSTANLTPFTANSATPLVVNISTGIALVISALAFVL